MKENKIIIESKNILEKYKGKVVSEVLEDIRKDLKEVLEGHFISESDITKFPFEFENDLGKWRIEQGGITYFQPNISTKYITVNINLNNDNTCSSSLA